MRRIGVAFSGNIINWGGVTFAEWLHVLARVLPLATFLLDWTSSNGWASNNYRAAFLTFASLRIPWATSCDVLLVVEKA